MAVPNRASFLPIQNENNKRLHSVNCCNIFQILYTADLNSALYLYTEISSIPGGFVCNLLIMRVSFNNKKPFYTFLN